VQGDLLLRANRLFDGRAFVEPGALLVRGGRIVAVGRSVDGKATRTIDLGDATILPGLVDLHVHGFGRCSGCPPRRTFAATLRGGVTTVRDLGSPLPSLRPAGSYEGLRVLMAGPLITAPGGYPVPVWGPAQALPVRSPADARRAVRTVAARGAAVVKIALESLFGQWPMLSVPEVRAIVAEAHRHRLRVTAHALGVRGVETAVAGGVDELAHTPCGATNALMRRIAARRIPVVSTLHVEAVLVAGGCGYVASRLVSLGERLLYGTDVGNRGIPYGIDVDELRRMRAAGMTPSQVLAAATSRAGAEAGLAPLGTLARGAPADVIAVRGDARRLADDLASPLLVVSAGRVVVAPRR
jgi:imidazolonepropionase-like amidohydrolase